jgi:hypothetical protein
MSGTSRPYLKGDNWVTTTIGKKREIMKVDSARFPCWGHYPPNDGHELEFFTQLISNENVGTGVDFELDKDGSVMWTTFWYQGIYNDLPSHLRWKEKLSQAWKILRGQTISYEEFMFDQKTVEAMGNYLLERSKEMEEFNTHIQYGKVPDKNG